jgi:hypothetical protein
MEAVKNHLRIGESFILLGNEMKETTVLLEKFISSKNNYQ